MPSFDLVPGHNCWRIEQAHQFSVIIDAAEYFAAVRQAMLQARKSIFLIGWDFDARIRLGINNTDGGPDRLGPLMIWLANRTPDLQIRLLRWDTNAFAAAFQPVNLWTILRWKAHPQITLRLDAVHPLAASHHQKIVVIDDCMAFCGGIDMTIGRWDTSEHLDDDPRRAGTFGRIHKPWHDATCAFDGPAARALGDLARKRWLVAAKQDLPPVNTADSCWPKGLPSRAQNVQIAIARTIPKMAHTAPVHEIEDAWVDMIASAKRYIYAESQYFVSRKIAHAIAERLSEENPPEIVVINPYKAEGWIEPIAMDSARARLVDVLRKVDHAKRLRVYHPVTAQENNIYVHAKIMIVDDDIVRVGSSNFNNRSMRLDTECDVILSTGLKANATLGTQIRALRNRLLGEHLNTPPEMVQARMDETGSLIETIEGLRGPGRSLIEYQVPTLSPITEWLAENEILDPNGPDEMFEYPSKRGLFRGWSKRLRRRLRRS